MISCLRLLAKIFLFWYVFFTLQQIIFLVFNLHQLNDAGLFHVLLSFGYAINMNVSAISYLAVLPFLLVYILAIVHKKNFIRRTVYVYMMVLVIINLIICTADIGLYHAWSSKINSKALYYLLFPATAVSTIEGSYNYILVSLLIIEVIIAIFLINRYFKSAELSFKGHWTLWIFSFIITSGLLFLGLRGGTQTYPISRSWVYYSKHAVLNNAAMNGFWNFVNVLFYMESKNNPYTVYEHEKAMEISGSMFDPKSPPDDYILKTNRPNIVLVLLESWSAEAIQCLGGVEGITPGFDKLSENGILFSDFYSSGFRTEQGFVAILSGFPAQPQTTIIRKFGKFEHLPGLVRRLGGLNYQSSYYYSGNLEFANTGAFLKVAGFDIVYGEENFPVKRRTRWGAYDEELFAFHAKDARSLEQPFFSVIMTSTSHEPFNGEVSPLKEPVDEPARYLNTVHYTDSCLYDYFLKVKAEPWYKNTLFVITADHGHYNPNGRAYNSPERHKIPFLLYGDVIKDEFKGTRSNITAYHPDIPVTLIQQLGEKAQEFAWGNDLFRHSPPHYAFYTFDNGFGIIRDTTFVVFDHNLQKVVSSKGTENDLNSLTTKGRSLMQIIVQKYIDLDN